MEPSDWVTSVVSILAIFFSTYAVLAGKKLESRLNLFNARMVLIRNLGESFQQLMFAASKFESETLEEDKRAAGDEMEKHRSRLLELRLECYAVLDESALDALERYRAAAFRRRTGPTNNGEMEEAYGAFIQCVRRMFNVTALERPVKPVERHGPDPNSNLDRA